MNQQHYLDCLARTHTALLTAIEGLNDTEMTELAVAGRWTIREILAHISGWAAWDLAGIQTVLAGGSIDFAAMKDVDTFNDQLIAERAACSLHQILTEINKTHAALYDLLTSVSDENLLHNPRFKGPFWTNMAEWVEVIWKHEQEHVQQIQVWRANRGQSTGELS